MSQPWRKLDEYSTWRKIAMGMWSSPDDPTVYGQETVDVSGLLDYLDDVRRTSGTKVTITAFTAKMIADVLEAYPDLNCMAIGNHLFERDTIDIFCQVAIPGESAGQADLSGVKLERADELDLVEIAEILRSKAGAVREGEEIEMEESKSTVESLPNALLDKLLDLLDVLTYQVPLDLEALGIRNDPFGSAMVTSVGQFDIMQGFAPLLPGSHCPIVALPGTLHDAPFVEGDDVVVRKAVTFSFTFDHRVYDGLQIGHIVRGMRSRLDQPREYYPDPEYWADEETGDERLAAE